MVILFFFLNLNPHKGRTFREHVSDFDFLGLFLIVGGVLCLLIGLNSGQTSWSSAKTVSLLTVGSVMLVSACFCESFTSRSPIIPARLFKTRTTAVLLIVTFFHAIAFLGGAYYLPLYFQVLGSSATGAGVRMLPFSLGASLFAMISGVIVTKSLSYRPVIWASLVASVVGFGLMSSLDSKSNTAKKVLYPFVSAAGLGCLLQTPLIALQAAMPIKDLATSTSTFGFVRLMGGTVGITIGQVIFINKLRKKLQKIAGVPLSSTPSNLSESVRRLRNLPEPLRGSIVQAFAQSVATTFLVSVPIMGFCLVISLFLRHYTLDRMFIMGGAPTPAPVSEPANEPRPSAEEDKSRS